MIGKKYILIIFVGLIARITNAQDVNFTQFYGDKIYLNPALTGTSTCNRVFSAYRNQWPSVQNAYNTFVASYDMPLPLMHGGVGVRLMHDNQGGIFRNTSLDVAYSYHLQVLRDLNVLFGITASALVNSQSAGDYILPSQINPVTGTVGTPTSIPGRSSVKADFSTGIAIFYRNIYGGAAVNHLTRPIFMEIEDMQSRIPMKFTVHAGAKFILVTNNRYGYEELSISPNLVAQIQGDNKKLNYGMYLQYGDLVFGAWLRQVHWTKLSASSFLVGIEKPQWKAAYSYDFSLSKIGYLDGGAHEISVAYSFGCVAKRKYKGVGTITCPAF